VCERGISRGGSQSLQRQDREGDARDQVNAPFLSERQVDGDVQVYC
jgi:hypothetical protein